MLLVIVSVLPAQAANWTVQTTSTGWKFVGTGVGNQAGACKMAVLMAELVGINAGVVTSQYGGSNATWATAQSNRLAALGMNGVAGDEGFDYSNNLPAGGLPAGKNDLLAHRSWNNNAGFGFQGNVKDIYTTAGTNADNIICGSPGGTANQPDYWDSGSTCGAANCENAKTFYADCLGSASCSILQQSPANSLIWEYQGEETDNHFGFNKITHQDLGYFLLAQPPALANNSGVSEGSPAAHTYTDHTSYWKLRAADLLVTEYECSGNGTTWSGTGAACCTGAGTGNCSPFADATFAGGSNPFGDTYIGATPAADALSNATHGLNHAWGLTGSTGCTTTPSTLCNSGYTVWNSTSLADLASNAYATDCTGATCHGVGTGFIDENGKRLSNNGCSLASTVAWGTNAQIVTDSHTIVADQATRYVNVMENAFTVNTLTNHPPWAIEAYNPPSYVLKAEAAALVANGETNALFWFSPGSAVTNGAGVWSSSVTTTLFNGFISSIQSGSASDFPIHVADFWVGNGVTGSATDDPIAGNAPGDNVGFDVQNTRGTTEVSYWQLLLGLKDSNGKYPLVVMDHLYSYDNAGQTAAFGWWTSNDNLLDGAASTNLASGTWNTACAANTLYTGPAGCKDGNGHYQGFMLTHGGTCTTATGGAPLGSTSYGTVTSGTCTMRDEGTVVPIAETSTQVGASGHAAEYGNSVASGVILPIQNFLKGTTSWTDSSSVNRTGFCDPTTTPTGDSAPGTGFW